MIIRNQIWELFPSFCILPTDLTKVLILHKESRLVILSGLYKYGQKFRKFVKWTRITSKYLPWINQFDWKEQTSCTSIQRGGLERHFKARLKYFKAEETELEPPISVDVAKRNIECLAVYSKNFLPIFFNLLGTPSFPTDHVQLVLNTIESYVSITESQVIYNIYIFWLMNGSFWIIFSKMLFLSYWPLPPKVKEMPWKRKRNPKILMSPLTLWILL